MDQAFYKLWEEKKYKDGIAFYRQKVSENDRNINAKEALALFLFMAGRCNKLKGAIAEAVSLSMEMLSRGEGLFGANMVVGFEKSIRMGPRESIDNYYQALMVACDIDEKKIALTRLAISLTLVGRANEAEAIIKDLVALTGITPLVQCLRVNILRQQKRFKESVVEYRRLTLIRKVALVFEYVAATLRYSKPNAAAIARNLPTLAFLLLVTLHSIFHLIGADATLNILMVLIISMTILHINLMGVVNGLNTVPLLQIILEAGIKYGAVVYLVETVLIYFYNHPNPGEVVNYPEIMVVGLALSIVCYIGGEYAGYRSGKRYIGVLVGGISAVIGIMIWEFGQYLIVLSWDHFFQVWGSVYNIAVAFVLGLISGLFGAVGGVKFVNTFYGA